MATAKKITTVTQLTDKLKQAKAIVLTDYQGLSHRQLEELRKILKKTEAEFIVTKNSLLKLALLQSKKVLSETHLKTATAALFAFADEAVPIKELVKFLKNATKGSIKTGLLGDTQISLSQIEQLATLPTKKVLISQLVGQLQAPLYGLHNGLSWNLKQLVWTLNAVKSKKNSH